MNEQNIWYSRIIYSEDWVSSVVSCEDYPYPFEIISFWDAVSEKTKDILARVSRIETVRKSCIWFFDELNTGRDLNELLSSVREDFLEIEKEWNISVELEQQYKDFLNRLLEEAQKRLNITEFYNFRGSLAYTWWELFWVNFFTEKEIKKQK